MNQNADNSGFHYILEDNIGQYANQSLQEQIKSFDFEEYIEKTLLESTEICEDKLEAEKAMATEKFFKEAYDNLLNMKCSPISDHYINRADIEELRKKTEKFLQESYNNLLGVSQTPKDNPKSVSIN